MSYPSCGLPDSPMPRWSTATTEKSRASAGISMRQAYQVCGQPCTSSSGGPVAAGDRVQAQLAGVDVPAGERVGEPRARFGAPETEPGPSGVGSAADGELMTTTFGYVTDTAVASRNSARESADRGGWHGSSLVDVEDGSGEGFRRFLRKTVPDTAFGPGGSGRMPTS